MTAATLTYIDADLAEKQRIVQVVVFLWATIYIFVYRAKFLNDALMTAVLLLLLLVDLKRRRGLMRTVYLKLEIM